MSLLADLPVGAVVGIDSVVFIYFIEEHTRYESVISGFFEDRLEHGSNRAITSVITLAEVLVQPKRIGRADLVQEYRDTLAEGRTLFSPTSPLKSLSAAPRCGRNMAFGFRMPCRSLRP